MSSRITHFMRNFLSEQGRLPLPGFGVIHYDGTLSDHNPSGAGVGFAPGSLSFHPDAGVAWDGELVQRIADATGKMRTLVVSDLDSYLQFGHELTNISKPFHIEGIGWIHKDHRNEVSFMQEDSAPGASGRGGRKKIPKGEATLYTLPWRTLAIWAGIALAALAGLAAYRFADQLDVGGLLAGWRAKSRASDSAAAAPLPPRADTARRFEKPASSTPRAPDSFSVVLEVSSRNRALKRYADLKEWGHNVRMTTADSQQFKIFIPIQAPLSDTVRHRDSLRIFFNRRVWIETHPDE